MPYDVFENDMTIAERQLRLRKERYGVLIVPAAEVIPYATLAKAKAFFDAGGVVLGYGILPQRSATLGKTSADISRLCEAIWGGSAKAGLAVCRTNAARGRAYFLPEKPTPEQIQQVLTGDAGIRPTLEVLDGETDDWLHVLHRVKAGRDVFLICNQQHEGATKRFRFRARAAGTPECWDAMRNQVTSLVFHRPDDEHVDFCLTLEPLESVLIVFQPGPIQRPRRTEPDATLAVERMVVERVQQPATEAEVPEIEEGRTALSGELFVGMVRRRRGKDFGTARHKVLPKALEVTCRCKRGGRQAPAHRGQQLHILRQRQADGSRRDVANRRNDRSDRPSS